MRKKAKKKRYRKRRWFTVMELVEVWDRWQRGESSKAIGRMLEREGSVIHQQLAMSGGIRPRERCRSPRTLTLAEREEISRGIAAKQSIRSIAVGLGRSPSTVSREIGRNGGYDKYRGVGSGRAGMGACASSEAVSIGPFWAVTRVGRRETPGGLGTGTDCGLAETHRTPQDHRDQ